MPLFGKKVTDEQWAATIGAEVLEPIEDLCSLFETTGNAVAEDLITGWADAAREMASLGSHEQTLKAAKAAYADAGKPQGLDALTASAKRELDAFFSSADMAMHWGKLHYADASGGPGQRARLETGFAQKAAITRVSNNGRQFANNAISAAKAGRSALKTLSAKQQEYRGSGPSLMQVLVGATPQARELLRQRQIPLSAASQVGAWCFQRSAILGMVVASDPDPFILMVWDPQRADRLWSLVDEALGRPELEELRQGTTLGFLRLKTAYGQLYGDDAMKMALDKGTRAIEKIANSPLSLDLAQRQWSMDTAIGFGLGVKQPELVRASLESEANPDREEWRRAHEAGLDIPSEPEPVTVAEQIEGVVETCRQFFEEYYPIAKAKLDEVAR
jgi:hypothetical protein